MENNETKPNDAIHTVFNSKKDYSDDNIYKSNGLTKREYFAVMALQGALANKSAHKRTIEMITESSVRLSDALIKELNKTK